MSDAAAGELAILITVLVLGGALIYLFDRWERAVRRREGAETETSESADSER